MPPMAFNMELYSGKIQFVWHWQMIGEAPAVKRNLAARTCSCGKELGRSGKVVWITTRGERYGHIIQMTLRIS